MRTTDQNEQAAARMRQVADRRGFLKLAGASAVTGATGAVAATPATVAAEPDAEAGLSRETEHIRRYYELAR